MSEKKGPTDFFFTQKNKFKKCQFKAFLLEKVKYTLSNNVLSDFLGFVFEA
jgi:hypothetical protein